MKILEIHTSTLDARPLNLELGGGMNLIYGPNEAGKSTLRSFLTSSLVNPAPLVRGRRRKNHVHASQHTSGRLRIEAKSQVAEIEFNGLSEITYSSGSRLAFGEFERARSALDSSIYTKIYCIDAKEAAGLGEMTHEELQNFLYQLSIFGNFEEGRVLQQVIESLTKEKDRLFSPSANAKVPAINKELRELRELEKDLNSQRKRIRSYENEIIERTKIAREINETKIKIKENDLGLQGYEKLLELNLLKSELVQLRNGLQLSTLPESHAEFEDVVRRLERCKLLRLQLEQANKRMEELGRDHKSYYDDIVDPKNHLHYQKLKDNRLVALSNTVKSYKNEIAEKQSRIVEIQRKLGVQDEQLTELTDEIYTLHVERDLVELTTQGKLEFSTLKQAQRELEILGQEYEVAEAIDRIQSEIKNTKNALTTLDAFMMLKQRQGAKSRDLSLPKILLIVLIALLAATTVLSLMKQDVVLDLTSISATLLTLYLVILNQRTHKSTQSYMEYKELEGQATKLFPSQSPDLVEIESKRSSLREDLRDLESQFSKVQEKRERLESAHAVIKQATEHLDDVQKKISLTFQGCGVVIETPFETAVEYLEHLRTIRDADKVVADKLSSLQEVKEKLKETVELAQMLGFPVDPTDEKSLSLVDKGVDEILLKHDVAVGKVEEISEQLEAIKREIESFSIEINSLEDGIGRYLSNSGIELELNGETELEGGIETLRLISKALATYESKVTSYGERQKEIENTFSKKDSEELLKLSEEELEEAIEQLKRDRESLVTRGDQLQNRLGELNQIIRESEDNSPIDTESRLNAKKEQLHSHIRNYVIADATRRLIQEIKEFRERTTRPAVLEEASGIFELITQGRYKMVGTRDPSEGGIFVELADAKERRSLSQLSTGTLEELSLAIRLGYINVHGQGEHKYPIVLDDVLVNFDKERATATISALAEVAASQQRQIILLTCHDREMNLYRELLGKDPTMIR